MPPHQQGDGGDTAQEALLELVGLSLLILVAGGVVDVVVAVVVADKAGQKPVDQGGDLLERLGVLGLDNIIFNGLIVVEEPGHGGGQDQNIVLAIDGLLNPLALLGVAYIDASAFALIDADDQKGSAVEGDGFAHRVGKAEEFVCHGGEPRTHT